MTKYILIGGYVHKAEDGGKAFCEELVKDFNLDRPIRILNCLFARAENFWSDKIKENEKFFSKYIKSFELILADPLKFAEQVKNSDVVYIQGGYTDPLMKKLLENNEWIKYIDGKTIAGTSAGGDAIAKYYCVLKTKRVGDGLGLLPIKFIPHWKSDYSDEEVSDIDWNSELNKLKEYKEDLPIYTLAEGEFKVITR